MKRCHRAVSVYAVVAGVVLAAVSTAPPAGAATTYSVTASTAVGRVAYQVAVDPTTGLVYAANSQSDSISVVNGADATVVSTIALPAGSSPIGLALDPALHRLYSANYFAGTVSVIDTTTNQVTGTVTGVGSRPLQLAADPVSHTLYVNNNTGRTTYAVDASTLRVTSSVAVPNDPFAVAVDTSTATVWVASRQARTLTVFRQDTGQVVSSLGFTSELQGVVVDSAAHTAYVIDSGNQLTAVDTTTRTVIRTATTGAGPSGVSFDHDAHTVVVANRNGNTLQVFDDATLSVLGTVALPSSPFGVAVDGVSHRVFVAADGANRVYTVTGAVTTSPQVVTFTSTQPSPGVVGGSYVVTATGGGSGNPVTFTADSTSTGCTVADRGDSSALVTFTESGTCVVDADQAGNADYTAAPRVQQDIQVDQPPAARIASPVCEGLTCSFDGSSSSDSDGSVVSYAWDFGDGAAATGPTTSHTYSAGGTYTVALRVTDDDGVVSNPASESLTVTANQAPTAVIASSCQYLVCTFDGADSADPDGTVASYAWDFGDGTAGAGATPSHTYARAGNYTVTLVVTDNRGTPSGPATTSISPKANQAPTAVIGATTCTFLVCSFHSDSTDPDGAVRSVRWSFDDGTTSAQTDPTHTFPRAGAHVVTLVAVDDQGRASQKVSSEIFVIANVAPVASFTRQCTYLTCTFDGARSADSDGDVASYAWDFGDGTTGTGVTTSHTYARAGTYRVTLRVTDDQGSRSKLAAASSSVVPNKAPTAVFAFSCTGLACGFDASTSVDSDGTIASFAWNYGDGSTGTGVTTNHTYTAKGRYTVILTVTDNGALTDTARQTVTVTVANQSPIATFGSNGIGLAGNFDGRASVDPDGTIVAYAWDFGDGTSGTEATPSHTYAADGTYPVTLTVTDNKGGTSAFTDRLTIAKKPGTVLVADAFADVVARGWGLPSVGWGYSYGPGNRAIFAEDGGVGRMTVGISQTVNVFPTASELNTTQTVDIGVADAALPATGFTAGVSARRSVGAAYQLRITVAGSGAVTLTAVRVAPNQPDLVLGQVQVAGLTATPSSMLRLDFKVSGAATPVLTGTVWDASEAQPAAQITASDTSAGAITVKGGVGLTANTYGTNATGPVVVEFDNYQVTRP